MRRCAAARTAPLHPVTQAAGFVAGLYTQTFMYCLYGWAAGMVAAALVAVPDYPMFNRHPITWLASLTVPGEGEDKQGADGDGDGEGAGDADEAMEDDAGDDNANGTASKAGGRRAGKGAGKGKGKGVEATAK